MADQVQGSKPLSDVWCEWCGNGPWLGDNDYEQFCSSECIDAWNEHWRNDNGREEQNT